MLHKPLGDELINVYVYMYVHEERDGYESESPYDVTWVVQQLRTTVNSPGSGIFQSTETILPGARIPVVYFERLNYCCSTCLVEAAESSTGVAGSKKK